jgi:two-component sensor histidine kinase
MSFKFFSNNSIVKFNIECENIYLKTKQAIPVSLIFNELISNYFKYAVNGLKDPLMKLIITESDHVVRFSYSDNGPGLPANYDILKTKSLGSKLIILFLKQLKAKYEILGENGFFLKFEFEIG